METVCRFYRTKWQPTSRRKLSSIIWSSQKWKASIASSTLWSVYSMINHKCQLLYGLKWQKFPRLTMLLKSYEATCQRKVASTFTKGGIKRYLEASPDKNEQLKALHESSQNSVLFRWTTLCRFSFNQNWRCWIWWCCISRSGWLTMSQNKESNK